MWSQQILALKSTYNKKPSVSALDFFFTIQLHNYGPDCEAKCCFIIHAHTAVTRGSIPN